MKSNSVPHEHPGLDRHTFTNESVTADLAMVADLGALLNFNKCADLCLIADFATVKVDESMNSDVSTKFHVRRDPAIRRCLSLDTTHFG